MLTCKPHLSLSDVVCAPFCPNMSPTGILPCQPQASCSTSASPPWLLTHLGNCLCSALYYTWSAKSKDALQPSQLSGMYCKDAEGHADTWEHELPRNWNIKDIRHWSLSFPSSPQRLEGHIMASVCMSLHHIPLSQPASSPSTQAYASLSSPHPSPSASGADKGHLMLPNSKFLKVLCGL